MHKLSIPLQGIDKRKGQLDVIERILQRLGLGGADQQGLGQRATVGAAGTTVNVDLTARYQTVEGWGTSLCWWAVVAGGWPDSSRNRLADLIFDPVEGLGLNVVRYNIGGGENPAHNHMRAGGAVPGYQPQSGQWVWGADANQRWMLAAARARGANIFEAFANSAPYWMTHSGCAAGSVDGGDNLRDDMVDTFADYLAEVALHFREDWGVEFRTLAPFNEPLATHWKTPNKQEGCHVGRAQQNTVVKRLAAALAARGLDGTGISSNDEFRMDDLVDTFASYDGEARSLVAQLNTHSYSGNRRADVREVAETNGKRLWMSEYGCSVGPHDHDAMDTPLALSAQIRRDMTGLRPAAWVYWQAVEDEAGHNWGLIHVPFSGDGADYAMTKSYDALGHYSRFIRPGSVLVGCDNANALAAYAPSSQTLVVVHDNGSAADTTVALNLRGIEGATSAAVYRTSARESLARLPDIALSGSTLLAAAPARSITTYVIS